MPDYEYITRISSPNHSGRRPGPLKGIIIHWWGNPKLYGDSTSDANAEGVARYLSRQGGSSSAHYVVSGKKVYCIVDPDSIAWHAGVYARNADHVGVEIDPDAPNQADTYATVAALVKDLRKAYGNVPLRRHRDFKNTACPGNLDVERIDRLARGDVKAPSKPVQKPKPVTAPKPSPKPSTGRVNNLKKGSSGPKVTEVQRVLNKGYPAYSKLVTDGVFGPATEKVVKEFQRRAGLVADGIVGPLTRKRLGL